MYLATETTVNKNHITNVDENTRIKVLKAKIIVDSTNHEKKRGKSRLKKKRQ